MGYIVTEMWVTEGKKELMSVESLEELAECLDRKMICCGDFNAHSTLWGNGKDEEFMEHKNLESAIDLVLVSDSLAGICSWNWIKETTIGSDDYPIMIEEQ